MTIRHKVCGLFSGSLLLMSLLASPASAATRYLVFDGATNTFSTQLGATPWISIFSGDTVVFSGLRRGDGIVHVGAVPAGATGAQICYPYDPSATNHDLYAFKTAFNGAPGALNEFTGPPHEAVSGLWALAPEGGRVSLVETTAASCAALNNTVGPALGPGGLSYNYVYSYEEATFKNGDLPKLLGVETNANGTYRLCEASTSRCPVGGGDCELMSNDLQNFDPSDAHAVPPGAYFGGLMDTTYDNPDVTGVVLRVSWNDIQRDNGSGVISFDWHHIDREFQRALSKGKLVTLDVRAGRYGTPAWLFQDYLKATSPYHASWCTTTPCTFAPAAPPGAGAVMPLAFKDYYDENASCGVWFRIGHPADPAYRAAYAHMLSSLAAHIAADSRRFAALAHVKVSGLNLQTSEAELPHHCDDEHVATGFPVTAFVRSSVLGSAPDNVLDVWQRDDDGELSTEECACNTELWYKSPFGYTPDQVVDYYRGMENQILLATFGKKSIGYQIIQAGFPRANSGPNGGFLGDHLYREVLAETADPAYPDLTLNTCVAEDHSSMTNGCPAAAALAGLVESTPSNTVTYCSADVASAIGLSPLSHCSFELAPLLPSAASNIRAFTAAETLKMAVGGRYPDGTETAEDVLESARNGEFGAPTIPGFVNLSIGKHFVPQHSGLQPLPQEQLELSYKLDSTSEICEQQSWSMGGGGLPPKFAAGAVGPFRAVFPMVDSAGLPVTTSLQINHHYNGCPNSWIVEEGALPVGNGPPLLTGFQTTNNVRNLEMVESALMNLVYNTNGVFVELYEDVFWRARVQKGVGSGAAPLSSTATRGLGGLCEYTDAAGNPDSRFCYSKNLSQWSEELHLRRLIATNAVNLGVYPSFADPHPTSHSFTFVNPNPGVPIDYYLINPARCNPTKAQAANPAAPLNSLVRIRVW